MARGAAIFNGLFRILLFLAVFLLASVLPAKAAPSLAVPNAEPPVALMSLQDQCLSRAERSDNPDRMRAICIGWAVLAVDRGALAGPKANALKDACLREVRLGADGQIREFRAQGEAMCRNFYASVAP